MPESDFVCGNCERIAFGAAAVLFITAPSCLDPSSPPRRLTLRHFPPLLCPPSSHLPPINYRVKGWSRIVMLPSELDTHDRARRLLLATSHIPAYTHISIYTHIYVSPSHICHTHTHTLTLSQHTVTRRVHFLTAPCKTNRDRYIIDKSSSRGRQCHK